jgi:Ser/Thr protein kinase RdoA (MazF antagonist)
VPERARDSAGAQERRLALRVHRAGYRTETHVRSELQFLQAIAQAVDGTQIAVPRPLTTRSGELLVVGGRRSDPTAQRYCDLLTWVEGHELKPTRGLGPRSSFLLGEALARIHAVADGFECPPGFELPRWDGETMFTPLSPFRPGPMEEFLPPESWALFEQVVERTRALFHELDQARQAWGIIHKDFVLINCRFTRRAGAWNVGILDFDDLGWGYYLYDLAPLLDNLADFPDSYRELSPAFLAGYRSIRALPPELETHLPILMAARHAVVLTWLAAKRRRGETDLPIDRYVEIRVEAMRDRLARRP